MSNITTKQLRAIFKKVSEELQMDTRWNLWSKGRNLTQHEVEEWIRYNRPDLAKELSKVTVQEAEDKGFMLAVVAMGRLMGGYV